MCFCVADSRQASENLDHTCLFIGILGRFSYTFAEGAELPSLDKCLSCHLCLNWYNGRDFVLLLNSPQQRSNNGDFK